MVHFISPLVLVLTMVGKISTVNSLYTDTQYSNIICYNSNLTGAKLFAQKVTVKQKFCKKIAFNTSRSKNLKYLLESSEAILTNNQNIHVCFMRKQE